MVQVMNTDQVHKYLLQTFLSLEEVKATNPALVYECFGVEFDLDWSYICSASPEEEDPDVEILLVLRLVILGELEPDPEVYKWVAVQRFHYGGGYFVEESEPGSLRLVYQQSLPLTGDRDIDGVLIARTAEFVVAAKLGFESDSGSQS